MALVEAEIAVEAVGVGARLVGAELDKFRALLLGEGQGVADDMRADAHAAAFRRDMHALELGAPPAARRDAGDDRDLPGADDRAGPLDHEERAVGVGVDFLEGALVIRQGRLFRDLLGRQGLRRRAHQDQAGDAPDIRAAGRSDRKRGGVDAGLRHDVRSCLLSP